ncbi:GntR family transcriptional regulator [Amycolatopsis sp. La24]|uniref:GntR family transcriptional regulator n=1 Tax=Amycolatopsis sp. La24 TaxID=3028304 RepID=UPI0023AEDEDA|nr:GntR family transcriptional regulator [Amycolatopsis sp. La24]
MSALEQLPPRDTTALVRTVRDRMRQAIALGEIPAGVKLNQVLVAKQLGVSRMPVRAAIPELVTEGLLEPLTGGGVMVRKLTRRDVREVYEVRLALESRAVRNVAEARPAPALGKLQKIIDTHRPNVSSYDAATLLAADREFHMALLEATGNDYFQRAIVSLWSVVERAMVGVLEATEGFEGPWKEHAQIVRALRAGDADKAEAAVCRHLTNAAEKLAGRLPEDDALAESD